MVALLCHHNMREEDESRTETFAASARLVLGDCGGRVVMESIGLHDFHDGAGRSGRVHEILDRRAVGMGPFDADVDLLCIRHRSFDRRCGVRWPAHAQRLVRNAVRHLSGGHRGPDGLHHFPNGRAQGHGANCTCHACVDHYLRGRLTMVRMSRQTKMVQKAGERWCN